MLADDEDEDGGGFILRPSFPTVLEVTPVIDVPLSFSLLLSSLYCRGPYTTAMCSSTSTYPMTDLGGVRGVQMHPPLTALTCIEAALLYESSCGDNHENSQ